jgi:predicted permease
METLLRDVRYGLRTLVRSPGFSALAVLTLGLGIGVNAAMFSVAHGYLWKGPAVADPETLAVVYAKNRADGSYADFSYADYLDFREARDVFSAVIGYYPLPLSLSHGAANDRVWGEVVSGNYFEVLGVAPALGRAFRADEDRTPNAAPVAVISHRLWQSRFQGRPEAVGETLKLNGRAFTVIGVAPPRFSGLYLPGFHPDLWVPTMMLEALVPGADARPFERGRTTLRVTGRLRPGVSAAQAQAAVGAIAQRLEREFPQTNRGYEAAVIPEPQARPEPDGARVVSLIAAIFMAGVGLVLLVACANVAHLMLARATARQTEMALRLALGAERRHLVRQLLAEGGLLALGGGALGALLAWAGTEALAAAMVLPTDIPLVFEFGLDGRGLAYTLAVSLAAALASGLTPALQAARTDVVHGLKNDGRAGSGSRHSRLRQALVVSQVALSCLLLVSAGLALRTLQAVGEVKPGFETRGALLVSVAPGLQGYTDERGQAFYRQLLERTAALPGVRSASLARFLPLDFSGSGGTVYVDGHHSRPDVQPESVGWARVAPGYFEALGTRILDGRGFTWDDGPSARRVVVVNETLAKRYWPGASPLGRSLRLDGAESEPLEVVGVAQDGKYRDLFEAPQSYLYLPLAQDYRGDATLVVRGQTADPTGLLPALREAVRGIDADMPLYDPKTLEALVAGRAMLAPRFAAGLAGVFAVLALVLAMVGLYGVVAFGVARRAREIGIRLALGASPARVRRMVLAEGARLCAVGAALGLAGALAVSRLLSGLLFGVSAVDPATFALVPAGLVLAALLAAYLPSRRATRLDPVTALRSE